MKGVIFTAFNEMIEDEFGLETWESILEHLKPSSKGIYTSVEDYSDDELFAMIGQLSALLDKPVDELVEHFGYYLFGILAKKYSIFVESAPDLYSFLESIDGVIHKEVEKLYTNPHLPTIETSIIDENKMSMFYRSPRKLCHLAVGLIKGAAHFYHNKIELEHDVCMHKNASQCEFIIQKL